MAEIADPRKVVTFEEFGGARLYKQGVLRHMLVRKGLGFQAEVAGGGQCGAAGVGGETLALSGRR
ncbi:MAG: hypothetical protein ACE5G5_14535 [Candidatus Methylomirabilales bacterium]